MNLLDIVGRAYDETPLQPWPVRHDGSKAPRGDGWGADVLTGRLSRDETLKQFRADDTGWGFLTGKPSGNLELFEVEGRFVAEDGWNDFISACQEAGLGELLDRIGAGYAVRTPGGGRHLPFYVDGAPLASTKLASRPATPEELALKPDERTKTLIETRGERAFMVAAGSNGSIHPTGGKWDLGRGKVSTIATITVEERDLLYAMARLFDEMPERAPRIDIAPGPGLGPESFSEGVDELQTYVAEWVGVETLLTEDGWRFLYEKRDGEQIWQRPGKDRGASLSLFPDGGVNCYTSTRSEAWDAVLIPGAFDHATPLGVLAAVRFSGEIRDAMSWARTRLNELPPPQDPPGLTDAERELSLVEIIRRHMLTTDQLDTIPLPESIVAGYLFRNSLAWLVGPSGVGKSFVAVDIAMKVGTGGGWWHDNLVQGGKVLYIVAEGASGMTLRTRAWRKFYGVTETPDVTWIDIPIPLFDARWADALAEVVDGAGFDLIFVDTLARSSLGAEENSAKDTGIIIANLEAIRVRSGGACVVPIHHTGKDVGAGGRGSTAYKGAMESEIMVKGSIKTTISVEATKQKNVECPPPIIFRAETVDLGGIGHDGEEMSSVVLVKADAESLVAASADQTSTSGKALRQRDTVLRLLQRINGPASRNRIREELKKEPFSMSLGSESLQGILEEHQAGGFVTSFKQGNSTMWMLTVLGTEWRTSLGD